MVEHEHRQLSLGQRIVLAGKTAFVFLRLLLVRHRHQPLLKQVVRQFGRQNPVTMLTQIGVTLLKQYQELPQRDYAARRKGAEKSVQ